MSDLNIQLTQNTISVLYVDDEPDLLLLCKAFLEHTGEFRVETVTSAREALNSLQVQSYDAIVSDYKMPDMDGILFLKKVREQSGDIPFILFTGRGREEVVIEAINNGADFYLQKGGDSAAQFAELSHKIKQAVRRKQAEQESRKRFDELVAIKDALQASERNLRSIIETSPDVIWELTPDGVFTYISPQSITIIGYTPEEMVGSNLLSILTPEGQDIVKAAFENRYSRLPGVVTYDVSAIHKNGTHLMLNIRSYPLIDSTGICTGFRGVTTDITERTGYLNALHESEDRLRSFIENSSESVSLIDEEGIIIEWNRSSEQISGISKEEALGKTLWDLTTLMLPMEKRSQERREAIKQMVQRSLHTGNPVFTGPRIIEATRPDGRIIYTRQTIFPIKTKKGYRFGSISQDITEEKQSELALIKSEEKFRLLAENVWDVIWTADIDMNITYVSPSVQKLRGYTPEEVLHETLSDSMTPESFEKIVSFHQEWTENLRNNHSLPEKSHIELEFWCRDGTTKWAELIITPVFDQNNQFIKVIGVTRDIDQRKKTEEALIRANRQLNLLSSVTRHDILNKIAVIRGNLAIVEMDIPDFAHSNSFQMMKSATQAIQEQIEFTRIYQDLGSREPIWINIDSVIPRTSLPASVTLYTNVDGISIFADPMLEKVFFNLLDNSLRHGQQISEIRVITEEKDTYLTILWEDNGVGIPPIDKEQIFERGYGKNTGFGLFLAREILALTDISIQETGIEGKGARFEITVPIGTYRKE